MGLITYQDYAIENFGKPFPYEFFDKYYTGKRVPSWEDNTNHEIAIQMFDAGMAAQRAIGVEPMDYVAMLEPRFAFDQEALIQAGWNGFGYLNANDIKYASNG